MSHDINTDLGNSSASESEEWVSPFESLLQDIGAATAAPGEFSISRPDPMIGTPGQDAAFFPGQQNYSDTCAIRCQEFVLEQFTGQPWNEDALVREAIQHGWYRPGEGTPLSEVGNLLELHGVPIHRYAQANIFHLANELAQGHKVIVGLDSGEIWGQHPILESIEDILGLSGADHAVVVSGIDTSDPAHVQVIVSDPGTGQPAASYPLHQFLDAWQDSDFYMVSTREPAPAWLPEMSHFDYQAGHLPEVAGMTYEQFLTFEDHPELWDELTEHPTTLGSSDGVIWEEREAEEDHAGDHDDHEDLAIGTVSHDIDVYHVQDHAYEETVDLNHDEYLEHDDSDAGDHSAALP